MHQPSAGIGSRPLIVLIQERRADDRSPARIEASPQAGSRGLLRTTVAVSRRPEPSLAEAPGDRGLDSGVGPRYIWSCMTAREKLHLLADELSDAEAEAAFGRLIRERELLGRWTAAKDIDATEDAWALANAREAIREERW